MAIENKKYPRIKVKIPLNELFGNTADKWPNDINKMWEKEKRKGEKRLEKIVKKLKNNEI